MSSSYNKQYYIDYIKLELTGNLLHLEIPDETIGKIVDACLVEIQRYIDETKLITVPYRSCIDLTNFKHSAIVKVYRPEALTGVGNSAIGHGSQVDPMYAQMWSVFSSGGTMYNLQNYVLNYMSYNTLMQINNTTTTDMAFREDKHANRLYINAPYNAPVMVTIEYIPIFEKVDEITSDYWIDMLKRLSLARTKQILGRIRTRVTQSNALWSMDGETLLNEAKEELDKITEQLKQNSVLFYPID